VYFCAVCMVNIVYFCTVRMANIMVNNVYFCAVRMVNIMANNVYFCTVRMVNTSPARNFVKLGRKFAHAPVQTMKTVYKYVKRF
jgi:hypothetical protein